MEMLRAGGVQPVDGSASVSHELPYLSPDIFEGLDLSGRSVKLLDYTMRFVLPPADWRFVVLSRNVDEQAASMVKLIRWSTGYQIKDAERPTLAASLVKDWPILIRRLRKIGPTVELEYERVLAQPVKAAKQLARLVDGPFDVLAAASVVHGRGPQCLPDMAFEETT